MTEYKHVTYAGAIQGISDDYNLERADDIRVWRQSGEAFEKAEKAPSQITQITQQGDHVAEALTFVHGVKIELIGGDKANGRKLVEI